MVIQPFANGQSNIYQMAVLFQALCPCFSIIDHGIPAIIAG